MKIRAQIIRVLPRVFLLRAESSYDLAMCLWRYQEYYESPRYRGQTPSLIEYMKYYAIEEGSGCFSYPADVSGYNFPIRVVREVWTKGFPDENVYDQYVRALVDKIGQDDGYLIGTARDTTFSTLKHEIAHGLWHTNPIYRSRAKRLLSRLPRRTLQRWRTNMKEKQYHSSVWNDEMNAYLATGVVEDNAIPPLKRVAEYPAKFKALFREYTRRADLKKYLYD